MKAIEEEILNFLENIKSTGKFVATGAKDFMPIGLEVKGFGEVALPITPLQAQGLIAIAQKAPFGKGSKTLLDDKVRKAWEIDAKMVSFKNKEWKKTLASILEDVRIQLGVADKDIDASLYKLLIYEKGDFFTWHKDSEKEPDMFATLSITLPAQYEGGELVVRFQGQETVVDMSAQAQDYKLAYAAFYADCDHEIRTLREGYRITLVYNVLQKSKDTKYSASANQDKVGQLADLLTTWEKTIEEEDTPTKIILLEHQYTPENFSNKHLKLSDHTRVQMMQQAVEQAGFFMRLGLVTHYMSGNIDYNSIKPKKRGRRSYWDEDDYSDEDLADASMGDDIYDEYTRLENWANDGLPTLGTLNLKEDEILSESILGEDEPLEKEAEGYTGNAGMTMEYWYHYGAMVLWSRKKHDQVLSNLSLTKNLEWLTYYTENTAKELEARHHIQKLLGNIQIAKDFKAERTDGNGFAQAWLFLEDEKGFQADCSKLTPLFQSITLENWCKLIALYPASAFRQIFQELMLTDDVGAWAYWAELFTVLRKDANLKSFADAEILLFPEYLKNLPAQLLPKNGYGGYVDKELTAKHNRKIQKILICLFELNGYGTESADWVGKVSGYFSATNNRNYVNDVLAPVLVVSTDYKQTPLYQKIYAFCMEDLEKRVNNEPEPLPDWTREIPPHSSYEAIQWNILRNFMASPTQQTFELRAIKAERGALESAIASYIRNGTVDLKMETITKGSPHTLVITKTQKGYQIATKNWEADCNILHTLKEL